GVDPFEYTHISNFKRRVLDFAVAEINQHTDFNVTYEQIKRGRVITGFSFKFKQKKPKQVQIATETLKTISDSSNTIKPLTEPQIAKYSMILCKLG
ncbi:MAG: replication initiation protein, partial [Paludibacteraceae bacterium]|nr:replication initiation protein [Paludibacteraceae bacterium]